MTACRSAGLNELTRSSAVGLADGEDDAAADGPAKAACLEPLQSAEFAPRGYRQDEANEGQ